MMYLKPFCHLFACFLLTIFIATLYLSSCSKHKPNRHSSSVVDSSADIARTEVSSQFVCSQEPEKCRLQVIDKALKRAVQINIETKIPSIVRVIFGDLLEKEVYSQPMRYVERYSVLNETNVNSLWEVTLEASIDTSAIHDWFHQHGLDSPPRIGILHTLSPEREAISKVERVESMNVPIIELHHAKSLSRYSERLGRVVRDYARQYALDLVILKPGLETDLNNTMIAESLTESLLFIGQTGDSSKLNDEISVLESAVEDYYFMNSEGIWYQVVVEVDEKRTDFAGVRNEFLFKAKSSGFFKYARLQKTDDYPRGIGVCVFAPLEVVVKETRALLHRSLPYGTIILRRAEGRYVFFEVR